MDQQIFIHAGFPKTASTWLQKHFFPSLGGIHYIPHRTVRPLHRDHDCAFMDSNFGDVLHAERQRAGGLPVVISAEMITGEIWNGSPETNRNALRIARLMPNARILLTVRNQLSLASSLHRHYILHGGTLSAAAFFNTGYDDPVRFDPWSLHYTNIARLYADLFGSAHVRVMAYEQFQEEPRAFLGSLCDWLGVARPPGEFPLLQLERKNFSPLTLKVKRFLNFFGTSRFHHPLLGLISNRKIKAFCGIGIEPWASLLPPPSRYLPEETARQLKTFYASGNTRLARDYGLPLEKWDYPLESRPGNGP